MKLAIILFILPLASFGQSLTPGELVRCKKEAKQVTIIRDNWGVPHIYGKTDANAVFGLLYAQCEESFPRVEENNLEMLGRLSEIYGESHIYNDLQMRLIYDSAAAIQDYKNCAAWFRKLLDAAADGVNYYLYKHPEVQPRVLKKFQPWYQLMRTDGSISATQTGNILFDEFKSFYSNDKNHSTSLINSAVDPEFEPTGSNGLALGPSRTASGNSILYINPHVTFYFRSEMHMVSEEGLNAYGAVTWGQFFIYQGFNAHCGWMHTSSYADVADAYEEAVTPDGSSYMYDGKMKKIISKPVTIYYKNGNDFSAAHFATYFTGHGPVMAKREGKWISVKEKNRSMTTLMQSWLRTKARSFEEFKKTMDMRGNNSNNTVYAGDHGHIAYWHGNFMPRRDPKLDWSGAVDGSVHATEWKGLHTLDEIVHVYDPASGWIENCNSTPFTSAGSSSPKKENYPSYMAPDGQNFRALNAMRLLPKAHDMTIDRMISEIGYDQYLTAFDTLLPPLFAAFDALAETDTMKKNLAEAISLLRGWDKRSSASSVATTIAIEWANLLSTRSILYRTQEQASNIVAQARTMINASTASEKLEFLAIILRDLKKWFGGLPAWGEVNRYQRNVGDKFSDKEKSFPVGLGPGTWGSLPSFASRRYRDTVRRYGVSGNSFIACVEFGKKLKAKTVITGGQSFDPSSKHFTDQAEMYIDGVFKDVLFYKEDVLKHVEKKYHPGEM
jgi:acyl-homoserine-lactone acylase